MGCFFKSPKEPTESLGLGAWEDMSGPLSILLLVPAGMGTWFIHSSSEALMHIVYMIGITCYMRTIKEAREKKMLRKS